MRAFCAHSVAHRGRDEAYRMHRLCKRIIVDIENILDVLFRDDKCVPGYGRPRVEEGERVLVFIDFVRGKGVRDDFTKDAVLHTKAVY